MRISNNIIREVLGLSKIPLELPITQVDAISPLAPICTLMFLNKPDINLQNLDEMSIGNTFLIDELYYDEFNSDRNDFIRVKNPKYKFCKIVDDFDLTSVFYHNHPSLIKQGIRCQIDPGVILGGVDFSPVLADDGVSLVQFPQMGGVKLGSDVVVKYNTMIGKGTFGYTEIGDNTMIDFGCQIGHNCVIGKHCIIAAGTIIGGSTTVGDGTVIGIGAKIRNGLKIGSNVSIGMGSIVIKDIPDDCVVVGNPARIINHSHIFSEGGLV